MRRTWAVECVCVALVIASHSQGQSSKTAATVPTIRISKPECAVFLPERDEVDDFAKLLRADQFVRCERDGFPATLAPPWKTSDEAFRKLGDACDYYGRISAAKYPRIGEENLRLAGARCHINVVTLALDSFVTGLGQQPK